MHPTDAECFLSTFPFQNSAGNLVTGKVNADWTKIVRRNGMPSVVAVTVTEDEIAGYYTPSLIPDAAGDWSVILIVSQGGQTYRFGGSFEVITPAQADPAAALASTVSAVTTLTERLTAARAAKLDRIGAASIPVSSPTANAERITIGKGDTYSTSLGNPLVWDYDGPVDLSDAIAVTLTIRSRTVELTQTCTVDDAGEPVQTIVAELAGTETNQLLQKEVTSYDVTASFAGGADVTLFEGKVRVRPDQSP